MTPPTVIEHEGEPLERVVVRKRSGKTEDRLDIRIVEILSDVEHDMGEAAALAKDGVERDLQLELVYADWLHAAGAPTVIVYCHYDVQPVDPLDQWVRPPFEPRIENGRIHARGAADDKGQLHLHLWAARAWLQTEGRLPINVRYVFEGEEESGSTNFDA